MESPDSPNTAAFHEVTRLLEEAGRGKPQASDTLLLLVYEELRKLATHRMTTERDDHTLQATALVHEAYLRLSESLVARASGNNQRPPPRIARG